MTRTMCDACNPANYETGHDLYASYVDGTCASNANTAVRISSLATNAGNVGDCEPGNPAPARWVSWVQQRRAAGVDPSIYVAADQLGSFFNGYKLQNVRATFWAAGVPEPHYWICYPGLSYIPDGAVAVQTGFMGGFDISLVVDFWPGVDTGAPPDPPPPPLDWSSNVGKFISYPDGSGRFDEVFVGPDQTCYWGAWVGGAGGFEGSTQALGSLGAPTGLKLIDAEGCFTSFNGAIRLNIRGVAADGSRWVKVMDAVNFTVILEWAETGSTPNQFIPTTTPAPDEALRTYLKAGPA